MHGRNTTAAAQREQRLRSAREGARNRAVALDDRADIAAALRDAHRLAAQIFPARNTACFKGDCRSADAVIGRGHVIENLAALGVVLHVGDQDVDLALLEKLHTGRRQHRHQLHLRAEPFAEFVREIHVEAARLLRRGIE